MKRLGMILLLSLTFPVLAETDSKEMEQETQASAKSSALSQMEALAQAGIQEALKALQRSGGFYPFALVINQNTGSIQLVGYQGDAEKKPPAEQFAVALFLQLRELAEKDSGLLAAVVMKPFYADAADGQKIPGVWAAVDHRNETAKVLFQPLIPQESGHYTLGQIVYQKSDEAIFPKAP